MTQTMLKTAEPTIVPTPTSPFATKIPAVVQHHIVSVDVLQQPKAFSLPMMAVKSSGDDEPPAMKVAPATSSSSPNLYKHRPKGNA